MLTDIKPGDQVRKNHIYDGTRRAGKPEGSTLTVVSLEDHNPVDGPGAGKIAILSDFTWSFTHNLTREVDL